MRTVSALLIAFAAANSAFAADVDLSIPATATPAPQNNLSDELLEPAGPPKFRDKGPRVYALQVGLDRARFSPGPIDGYYGNSTRKAVMAYQESRGTDATGEVDEQLLSGLIDETIPALVHVAVDPKDLGPVGSPLPAKAEDLAGLKALPYGSLVEAIAEKFHTTPKALASLNGETAIVAGADIIVPNVEGAVSDPSTEFVGGPLATSPPMEATTAQLSGQQAADAKWQTTLASLSVEPTQPEAARLVVDRSLNELRAFDSADRLIAAFPATVGSEDNPSPEGELKINAVSRNPTFKYDTDVLNEKGPKKAFHLAAGPNNLVGVVWLDLSKPHNGIHGTSEPDRIGQKVSHGCVRLTNWDAARLAQMIKPGTPVTFR